MIDQHQRYWAVPGLLSRQLAPLDIGGSVLVNVAYLASPFEVTAIGPIDLFDRLSASAGFQDFVRTRRGSFGIGISWAAPATVDVPAFGGSVNLRESHAVASQPPAPAGSAPAESAPVGSAP